MIEVLLAIVVLGVSFAVLVGAPVSSMQSNTYSQRASAATNLARDKLEELRGSDYQTLSSGSDSENLTESGETGSLETYGDQVGNLQAIFSRSWSVTSGPVAGTLNLTVTVSWGPSDLHHIDLSTVVRDWG